MRVPFLSAVGAKVKNRETVYAVEFNFHSGHGIRTGLVKTKGHVTAKMVSARDWEISYTVSENKKRPLRAAGCHADSGTRTNVTDFTRPVAISDSLFGCLCLFFSRRAEKKNIRAPTWWVATTFDERWQVPFGDVFNHHVGRRFLDCETWEIWEGDDKQECAKDQTNEHFQRSSRLEHVRSFFNWLQIFTGVRSHMKYHNKNYLKSLKNCPSFKRTLRLQILIGVRSQMYFQIQNDLESITLVSLQDVLTGFQ